MKIRLHQTRLLLALAATLAAAVHAARPQSGDLAIAAPRQESLNPCFTVKDAAVRLVNGASERALEVSCGGILTWDIPQGTSSFHVTLWRAESANAWVNSQPAPSGIDPLRVLISLDGKPAADAVLRVSTPAANWVIPTNHAHTLSIETEQEYGAPAVYLGALGFSSQPVQTASVGHILSPGQGYTNLGTGPRQVAFFDFHPGESVPVQTEFAGNAASAEVKIGIAPLTGGDARRTTLSFALRPGGAGSVGLARWQVPELYGPAILQLTTWVDGRQVYSNTARVALAKAPYLSPASQSSYFGIHQSTSGSLYLQDDFVSLWGAERVRFFLAWNQIESRQGVYDWHWIDNLVESYRGQHLALLAVMGELPPKWITDPATQMMPAYARFVNAALDHFQGKIQSWDVYNEIDSKFYSNDDRGFDRESDPAGDIEILRHQLEQMNRIKPELFKVCCAPGGSDFLPYEKRLFDAGLLGMIDAVEMHPYQSGPPEESDYGLSYPEMVDRLSRLAARYGVRKPVWTTEANWLFGPRGTPGVVAPDVTEHEASQYLVRLNLLSAALHVPLYSHSPFFFPWRRDVLVDSLASYAQMTFLLSHARDARLLSLPAHVYGTASATANGTVLALWTDSLKPVSAQVSGLAHLSIQDMYGNPLPATENVRLSGSPVYVLGEGNAVVTATAPQPPGQLTLPALAAWKVTPGTRMEQSGSAAVHLTSQPTRYGSQLTSPILNVSPNGCYLIGLAARLHEGGINVAVVNPDTNKTLRNEFIYTVTGGDSYKPRIRIKTGDDKHLRVVFTASNPHDPAVSDFEVDAVTMSECP